MKLNLLLTLIFLTACATHPKKQTKIEIVKGTAIEKVDLPITTITFPTAAETLQGADFQQGKCEDEYLYFLIKEPFVGLNNLKQFYDNTLILNQDMQRLIEISIQTRIGKMAIEDFKKESTAINLEMNKINNSVEPLLKEYVTINYKTQAFYSVCVDRLKATMKAKKIDPNQDGCELEQQQGYILDPYEFKSSVNEAVRVEMKLHDYLNKMYKAIFDEIHGNLSMEQAQKQFLEVSSQLQDTGIQTKSLEAMDKVINSFKSTMSVKEQCEMPHQKNK